jgi:hypothetical protein
MKRLDVSRVIGHSRSTIVDTIYAHTVDSALAGISESVSERVGLTVAPKPEPQNRRPQVGLRSCVSLTEGDAPRGERAQYYRAIEPH